MPNGSSITPKGDLRPTPSARATTLTVLREHVLPVGAPVWTRTLVTALGAVGIGPANARQAIARVAEEGVLVREHQGREVRWRLTPAGHDRFEREAERLYWFGEPDDAWDERWVVVSCPVPEQQRARRQQVRVRLAAIGFGSLPGALFVSPHADREMAAMAVLEDLGLVDRALVLRADMGDTPLGPLVHRAWDLDRLATDYRRFHVAFARRRAATDEACFVAHTELMGAWQRFAVVDPEIPARLLPANWGGRRAKAVFDDRHEAWEPGARRWFTAIGRGDPTRGRTQARGARDDEEGGSRSG